MLKFHIPNVRHHAGVVFHVRAHKIHLPYRALSVKYNFNIPSFPSSVYLTFETRYSFQRRAFDIIPYKNLNEENYFLWPTADTTSEGFAHKFLYPQEIELACHLSNTEF